MCRFLCSSLGLDNELIRIMLSSNNSFSKEVNYGILICKKKKKKKNFKTYTT